MRERRAGMVVLTFATIFSGCDHHVRVTKEMSWECLPAEQNGSIPVILRYVEAPEYYDVVSSRGLCRQLQASGAATAKVTYDAWGSFYERLHGYGIDLINGQPLVNDGGSGRSGRVTGTGHNRPHPLMKALE